MDISSAARTDIDAAINGRPLRHAILVPEAPGLSWMTVFTGVLGALSRVWGGAGALVFPLEETKHELFSALVDVFDPDVWEVSVPSIADLQSLDPEEFSRIEQQTGDQLQGLPREEAARLREEAAATPVAEVSISEDLARRVVATGACFHHEGTADTRGGLSGSTIPYPMVDVLELTPLPHVTIPKVPAANRPLRLIAAAQWGELLPAAYDKLAAERYTPSEVQPGALELIRMLYGVRHPLEHAPFSLSEVGLTWINARPRVETRPTIVVGEHPLDFCLAYALRRARALGYWWCQTTFAGAERERALLELASTARTIGQPVDIVSITDPDAAKSLAGEIEAAGVGSASIKTPHWRKTIPKAANSLVFAGRPAHPQSHSITDGTTPPLLLPEPEGLEATDPSQLRWVAEVETDGWNPVRHPALGNQLVGGAGMADVRSSSAGVAIQCPGAFVQLHVPLPWQLPRPRLKPIDLLSQLQAIVEPNGWQVQLSDKGSFAVASAELWGGYEEFCEALTDSAIQALLCSYLDGAEKGIGKRLRDRRRYLTLADLSTLGDVNDSASLLESLERKRVLVRGLLLKCDRCRHTDFFRVDTAEPTFVCPRCSLEQRPTKGSWLGTEEPQWHYRLDEAMFQFILHRGDIPALTAHQRFVRSEKSAAIVPEIRIGPEGTLREIDFVVTDGADLWLGEGFSAERYEARNGPEHQRLLALLNVGELLNARGIVLATSAEAMHPGTRLRAESVISGSRPQLEIIEGAPCLPRPEKLIVEAQPD